jgi:hypothetical protein
MGIIGSSAPVRQRDPHDFQGPFLTGPCSWPGRGPTVAPGHDLPFGPGEGDEIEKIHPVVLCRDSLDNLVRRDPASPGETPRCGRTGQTLGGEPRHCGKGSLLGLSRHWSISHHRRPDRPRESGQRNLSLVPCRRFTHTYHATIQNSAHFGRGGNGLHGVSWPRSESRGNRDSANP